MFRYKTGSWRQQPNQLTHPSKDQFGRTRWDVPLDNTGEWRSMEGHVYRGVVRKTEPLTGRGCAPWPCAT